MTYSEKLKDPRWQRKRLEILERDGWLCTHCGDSESPLHVHHTHYEKGKMPWEYDGRILITLCKKCHRSIEELHKVIGDQLENPINVDIYYHVSKLISDGSGYDLAVNITRLLNKIKEEA